MLALKPNPMNHNETGHEPSKTDQEIARECAEGIISINLPDDDWIDEATKGILSALTKSKRVSLSGEGEKSLAARSSLVESH